MKLKWFCLKKKGAINQSEHAPPSEESRPEEEPSIPVVSIVPLDELPPKNEKTTEKASRKQAPASPANWWAAIGVGVIVLFLSIVINIGILAALNGGLRYVSVSEFVVARQEVDSIGDRLQGIRSNLGSLQERLDNLQGLSGRMDNLESNQKDLQNQLAESMNEIKQVQSNVEDISKEIEQLSDQVQEAQKRAVLFEDFVSGLRKLLETLQP
jgi:methyl-accepting chemotaxis protein